MIEHKGGRTGLAEPRDNLHRQGSLLMWITCLMVAWAGVPVLAKQGATHLNGLEMTFWITLFSLPVVTLWILPRSERQALRSYSPRVIARLAGVGLLGNLIYQILYFSSYQTISAITGSLASRVGALLFVTLSVVLLKERHSKAYLIAVLLTSIGAVLSTAQPGSGIDITTGFWLICMAALADTLYKLINNGYKHRYASQAANLFIFKVATFACIGAWVALTHSGLVTPQPTFHIQLDRSWSDLRQPFIIGACADGIGFLAFLRVLQLTDSVKTTIVQSAISVIQVVLAALVFRESTSWLNAWLAPLLVIVPTAVAQLLASKSRSRGRGEDGFTSRERIDRELT